MEWALGDDLRLPDGTRLLHIGPPKTATTSIQASFWAARDSALRQGVRYAGRSRHSAQAVLAVTGRRPIGDRNVPPLRHWERLLGEIRRAREPLVVLSSEAFSYAREAAIPRVIEDLDPSRVHLVVTLRPLPRLLASQWQENVQSGMDLALDDWLDILFNRPDEREARGFWHRHRHDRLIARWAEVVGPENVTAIVVNEQDRGYVLGAFERLTGLAAGTLAPVRDLANRSLTLPEMAAITALRRDFDDAGMSRSAFYRIVRMQVALHMKERMPAADEPRVEAPQWALDRAGEVARPMVEGIRSSGVRTLGDLDSLTVVPTCARGNDPLPDVDVAPEIAASAAMGALIAGGLVPRAAGGIDVSGRAEIEALPVSRVRTGRLMWLVGQRIRDRIGLPGRGRGIGG